VHLADLNDAACKMHSGQRRAMFWAHKGLRTYP
jgi:hypothetical protein